MARSKFNMGTVVTLADAAVANALVAKEKNQSYHHNLLLKRVIEVGSATCQELNDWLEGQKAALMTPAGVATWDKYSAACHLSYFINRCRGAVTAAVDGVAVPQGPTKVSKKAAKAEAAPVEAPVAEEPAEEPSELEAALADASE